MVRLCDYGAGNDILCATSGWNCDMGKDRFSGTGFFSPKRVGIHQKYFEILKFRTIRADTSQGCTDSSLENPDQCVLRNQENSYELQVWMNCHS